jgi:hypothetical protein
MISHFEARVAPAQMLGMAWHDTAWNGMREYLVRVCQWLYSNIALAILPNIDLSKRSHLSCTTSTFPEENVLGVFILF